MGFLRRMLGLTDKDAPLVRREMAAADIRQTAETVGERLIELKVVGESHRQGLLRDIAGPKAEMGKQMAVGATLRCEPTNPHDPNAVRVEVMGQLLGYVAREPAAVLSPRIQQACGGVLEARGLIVGGWDDGYTQGHYGIRVWITTTDASRLGVTPADIDPALRPAGSPWPALPPVAVNERRLSPSEADIAAQRYGSEVTVICEEHYQPAIVAAMPTGWEEEHSWPLLVELVLADRNPHSKHTTPCVEVRTNGQRVGFLTPAMTERHAPAIAAAAAGGTRVTATAQASWGTKAGAPLWRIKISMASGAEASRR